MKSKGSSNNRFACIMQFTVTLSDNVPVTLHTVNSGQSYATLYLPSDVTTDINTKAYYITAVGNGYASLTATPNEGSEIPARTAVVLVNSVAATETTVGVTSGLSSAVSEEENLLKGTLTPMQLDLSDESSYYSLGVLNNMIGFYKFENEGTTTITLGANKAYLNTSIPSGNVKGFTFSFETGINSIDKGQSAIDKMQIYNVAGQRLSKPVKGINIINGKKVIF